MAAAPGARLARAAVAALVADPRGAPGCGLGGASKASKRGGVLLRESGEIFVEKKNAVLVVGKWEMPKWEQTPNGGGCRRRLRDAFGPSCCGACDRRLIGGFR